MKIGKDIFISQSLALAPMEDVTDLSYRLICKRLGADLVYTEFTNSDGLVRAIPCALKKIHVSEEERPVAIQIYGSLEESMEGAARIAEGMNPDFIDINCGCWVKKVVHRGAGAGLLRDLKQFEKIVKSVMRGTSLPVTVKTRLGWDAQSVMILDVVKMLEANGVQAITLHCRTREQGYQGNADWNWLEKVRKVISIPLIGNGDLTTPQSVKRMFETGCDGAMIGRGAIGNPWIFKHSKHFLKTDELLPPPSLEERIDVCKEHLKLSVGLHGERKGITGFRKFYAGYFKGVPHFLEARVSLMSLVTLDEVLTRLDQIKDQSSCSLAS
jgi:tRNA-dihydrouridine synthase B